MRSGIERLRRRWVALLAPLLLFTFHAQKLSGDIGLAGNWKPVLEPIDERRQRLVRISFEPLGEGGGIRYAEGGNVVYEWVRGREASSLMPGEQIRRELLMDPNGDVSVRLFDDTRTLRTEGLRVIDGGATLLIGATSWDEAGKATSEGFFYRRVPESECGIRAGNSPEMLLYGCWVWLDGLRELERRPEAFVIEEGREGFRLISSSQTIELRKNGAISVSSAAATKPSTNASSHWKRRKQSIELTITANSEMAAGKMRLELSGGGKLLVSVENQSGAVRTYTYERQ